MKTILKISLLGISFVSLPLAAAETHNRANSTSNQNDKKSSAPMKSIEVREKNRSKACPSTTPAHRHELAWWSQRHQEKVEHAEALGEACQLVLLGDSITHSWEGPGKTIADKSFARFQALNLGFSGDHTSHLLWRIQNGEWPKSIQPKLAVVMIGTNNTGHGRGQPAEETAAGIQLIIEEIHQRSPSTHIILHPIFPRGATPGDQKRRLNSQINDIISKLDSLPYVSLLDCSQAFLDANGNLRQGLMPDLLHPNATGYQAWASILIPELAKHGLK